MEKEEDFEDLMHRAKQVFNKKELDRFKTLGKPKEDK